MKPTSTYKMSRPTKMLLSNIQDPHLRGMIKRDHIQADLMAAIKPKEDKKKTKDSVED